MISEKAQNYSQGNYQYDLSNLFSLKGLLNNTNESEMPDAINATVILSANASSEEGIAACSIAARLGFETAAISLPLVVLESNVKEIRTIENPILIGKDNRFVKLLAAMGRIDLSNLSATQGIVKVVPNAFGVTPAIVVAGKEASSTRAAAELLAQQVPFLFDGGKTSVGIVKCELEDIIKAKRDIGKAIQAISIVRKKLTQLSEIGAIKSLVIHLGLEEQNELLEQYIAKFLSGSLSCKCQVSTGPIHSLSKLNISVWLENGEHQEISESLTGIEFFLTQVDQILVDGEPPKPAQLKLSVYVKSHQDQHKCVGMLQNLNMLQKELIYNEIFFQKGLSELLVEVILHSVHAEEVESRIQVKIVPGSTNDVNFNKPEKKLQSQYGLENPKDFDLTDLFSPSGLLDADEGNLIPNNTNTLIILGADEPTESSVVAANIAARLGLESTGITLPIAVLDNEIMDISKVINPILIGQTNLFIQSLIAENKLDLPSNPHQGVVRVVPHAFGESSAVLMVGSAPLGTFAAGTGFSEHLPYLWELGTDYPTIGDVKTSIQQLLTVESRLGQFAMAFHFLKQAIRKIQAIAKPVASIQLVSYVTEKNSEIKAFFTELLRMALNPSSTSVEILPLDEPTPVWSKAYSLKWEVSDFWDIYETKILPKVREAPARSQVSIEVRVSEPKEIRKALEKELQNKLKALGFPLEAIQVRVLSAYKQGYGWIKEVVIPAIRDLPVDRITIKYQEIVPPKGQKWADSPSKWLLTLYPSDETIETELGIDKERVKFQTCGTNTHTFVFEAYDSKDRLLYNESFDVRYVERPYLEAFPDMTLIHPETGWITATVNQETIVEERIITDIEKLWDKYQDEVLPSVKEYILQTTEGHPTDDKQPFFESLILEAYLSEPDTHLGVREELFSTLEQLHEDLFFAGLDLVNHLGITTIKQSLRAPGSIIPWPIRQNIGNNGFFRATLNTFKARSPKMAIKVTFEDGNSYEEEQDLQGVTYSSIRASAVTYQSKKEKCDELEIQIEVKDKKALKDAEDILKAAQELRRLGFYQEKISWPELESLKVIIQHNQTTREIELSSMNRRRLSQTSIAEKPKWTPIMDRVIGYKEVENTLIHISQCPSVTTWVAGQSIKGRRIYAIDVATPTRGHIVSQAKLITFKPTYLLACHNHGHESSSTNAALALIDYLSKNQEYLKKVNICVIPFQNPDGASLHYEWQKEHPNWMLHGARFNAFSHDVNSDLSNFPTFHFPEAKALYAVWKKWLPDVIEDAHGFPSHEWTTPFEGYGPLWYRIFYLPSSAFFVISLPNSEFSDLIYRRMIDDLNVQEELRALNLLWNEQYNKYARKATFVESSIFRGVTWYQWDHYITQTKKDRQNLINQPHVEPRKKRRWGGWMTFLEEYPALKTCPILTEMADSTAQGPYMELCAVAHFIANLSVVRTLYEQSWAVSRTFEALDSKIYLNMTRERRF